QQRRPDAELALALQVGSLHVDPAHHHQLAVEVPELVVGEVDPVGVVLDEGPVLGEQPYLPVSLVHAVSPVSGLPGGRSGRWWLDGARRVRTGCPGGPSGGWARRGQRCPEEILPFPF